MKTHCYPFSVAARMKGCLDLVDPCPMNFHAAKSLGIQMACQVRHLAAGDQDFSQHERKGEFVAEGWDLAKEVMMEGVEEVEMEVGRLAEGEVTGEKGEGPLAAGAG